MRDMFRLELKVVVMIKKERKKDGEIGSFFRFLLTSPRRVENDCGI